MNTQSIIVYRNPLEQTLWEGLMDGSLFGLIIALIGLAALWVGTYQATDWVRRKTGATTYYGRKRNVELWVANIVTVVALILLHLWNIGKL